MTDLRATFAIDFSNFNTAMDKAVVSLSSFEKGAGKVETQLNKTVNSFSGVKIVQQASLAAEAVARIGGVSALTDAELQKLGRTAAEATQKLERMGQAVPAGIQNIANAAKDAAQKTASLGDALGNTGKMGAFLEAKGLAIGAAFGTFAGGLAAQAISKLGQEMSVFIDRGTKLPAIEGAFTRLTGAIKVSGAAMISSMSEATQHLVSDFDLMQSANKAMLLGLPVTAEGMGDLAKTATVLGRAMGQDATKSLDDLITALGRSSPMILDNLGLTVKVGEANEAYARKLGIAADALSPVQQKMAFYEAAMEAARKKTGELGDQTLTLSERVSSVWTQIGNVVTQAASDIDIGLGQALSSWKEFAAFTALSAQIGAAQAIQVEALRVRAGAAIVQLTEDQKQYIAAQVKAGESTDFLVRMVGASASEVRKYADSLRVTQAPVVSYVEQLRMAQANVAALTGEQRANLSAMIALGKEYKDLPKDIKLSASEFQLYKDQVQAASAASKQAAAEEKKHKDALAALTASMSGMSQTTYDVIVALSKQGQSEADIAKALQLHVVQVQYVIAAEKTAAENSRILTAQRIKDAAAVRAIMDDAIKRANESPLTKGTLSNLAIESRARRESADLQAKLSLNSYEYDKYLIRQWGEDQKRAVDKNVDNWQSAYAAIDQTVRDKLNAIVSNQQNVVRVTSDWSEQLHILSSEFQKLGSASGGTLGDVLGGIGQMVVLFEAANEATKQVGSNGKELGGSFGPLSVMFNKNATDAQQWGAAIQSASALASGGMDVWSESANKGSVAANTLSGAMAGMKAGAAFGPYGAAAGAAAGAIIGFTRSLDDGREAVEQFANRQGGFDRLHQQLQELGAEGEAMWKSLTQGIKKGDLDGASREILRIQQALSDMAAKAKWDFDQAAAAAEKAFKDAAEAAKKAAQEELDIQEELRAAIKEYGFTIEELGPKWRQQELDIQAQKLLRTYDLLVASGINVAIVQGRMADSINEYFHNALKTGATIPEAWRPILESMAAAGLLTDEFGNKMTDLSKVNWSQSLGDKFDNLADKLTKILNKLLGIGDALEYVGKKGDSFKVPEFRPEGPVDLGKGLVPPQSDPSAGLFYAGPQAAGGDYLVSRPTLFLAGEAGAERAIFRPASRGGRDGGVTIHFHHPVVREDRDIDRITDQIARRLEARGI